ncbi:MAG: ABC transporter permease subunit [Lachnospiraceae bacterium]|nr:ABC transporter permease subunit [Lachnospiraceae bacterium]
MADIGASREVVRENPYDDLLRQRKKSKKKARIKRLIPLYMMMLPGLIYLVCNNYLPLFGILFAFKKIDFSVGIFKSPWCGFDNFEFLFKTKDAWIMIRNTLGYNIAWLILGTIIAVFIALLMNEIASMPVAKAIQPIICFPSMISAVILSYLVYAFLSNNNGFINTVLLDGNGINWYASPQYWPIILTIVHFWQVSGQSSIIYMASIGGIDKGLYEAAKIDGAGRLKQIRYITLPLIKSMVILMTLMSIGKIFNSDFGLFYQVTLNQGMLISTTQTIDTYVYRALMEMNNIGMSSAASVFQAVLGFLLVLISNAVVSAVDSESALF